MKFYNIINYKKIDDNHFFYEEKIFYILKKTKEILNNNNIIYLNLYNFPIKNIYNSIYTIVDDYVYIVFLSKYSNLNMPTINQIMELSYYTTNDFIIYFDIIWNKKISYLINFNGFDNYYFTFLYGISINSILLVKNVNFTNVTYGLNINDYNSLKMIDNLNSFNLKKSALIRNYSMFIKNTFFVNNKKSNIDFLFNNNLSNDDYILFLCRMFFPDFYFFYFKTNEIDFFINKYESYVEYLDEIILMVKKRRKINVLYFSSLINLIK